VRRASGRAVTDAELIQDEVETQLSFCQCRRQYPAVRLAEGKYKVSTLTLYFFQHLVIFGFHTLFNWRTLSQLLKAGPSIKWGSTISATTITAKDIGCRLHT